MKVLITSSEVVPFAKTGGLADVAGALPKQLSELGHEVIVFMPAYSCTQQAEFNIEPTNIEFKIPLGTNLATGRLLKGKLPDSNVTIYFLSNDDFSIVSNCTEKTAATITTIVNGSHFFVGRCWKRFVCWTGNLIWFTPTIGKRV